MATAEGTEGVETEKTPAERLFEAARDGDLAALDALLPDATAEQLHEDHEHENEFGVRGTMTPLFIAAWCGQEAIVRRLISAGADVERGSSMELTPLMAAAAKSHYGCVAALIDAGADVNLEVENSENGHTMKMRTLHLVLQCSNSPEIVRLLLSRGADVDAVAREALCEVTPLSLAWRTSHPSEITDADALKRYFLNKHAIAFMLLRAGADVSHLFEERRHLATEERPHPSYETLPLVRLLHTDRHRTYVEAVNAAGGFASYARARQCQLLTIKLLARGHGCLNLPEALIPTVVSYWDEPWVPSFSSEGLPV